MAPSQVDDPLPSWNRGPNKEAIIDFVSRVSTAGTSDYIDASKRIVTFDNDGTLWSEKPLYPQVMYMLDQIKKMAPQHPEWTNQEPFASVLRDDFNAAFVEGEKAIVQMALATHARMTVDEYSQLVVSWLRDARHPETGRAYTSMVYKPMLELLEYLRSHSFKIFIVSGGGVNFVRVFAEEVYGVPPERIICSSLEYEYEVRDGVPVIVKQPEIHLINEKAEKPVSIHRHIGCRPVMAVGNSDGDFEMLEYTTAGSIPRLGVLIHHDDGEREWAYDRDSNVGKLRRGLDEGPERGWRIISMKDDWKTIY